MKKIKRIDDTSPMYSNHVVESHCSVHGMSMVDRLTIIYNYKIVMFMSSSGAQQQEHNGR